MYDLDQFKANFPAENHDLPAFAAREFSDAVHASQSLEAGKARLFRLLCQAALRAITAVARSATRPQFGGMKYSR